MVEVCRYTLKLLQLSGKDRKKQWRALLAAVGTRRDVQPALAVALELQKLGHAVRLCISPNFVDWAWVADRFTLDRNRDLSESC
jgi:hypothetical protein